jgi:hypothetical protein
VFVDAWYELEYEAETNLKSRVVSSQSCSRQRGMCEMRIESTPKTV